MNVLKSHALNVPSIERAVDFYETPFGVPANKPRSGYAKFELEIPAETQASCFK